MDWSLLSSDYWDRAYDTYAPDEKKIPPAPTPPKPTPLTPAPPAGKRFFPVRTKGASAGASTGASAGTVTGAPKAAKPSSAEEIAVMREKFEKDKFQSRSGQKTARNTFVKELGFDPSVVHPSADDVQNFAAVLKQKYPKSAITYFSNFKTYLLGLGGVYPLTQVEHNQAIRSLQRTKPGEAGDLPWGLDEWKETVELTEDNEETLFRARVMVRTWFLMARCGDYESGRASRVKGKSSDEDKVHYVIEKKNTKTKKIDQNATLRCACGDSHFLRIFGKIPLCPVHCLEPEQENLTPPDTNQIRSTLKAIGGRIGRDSGDLGAHSLRIGGCCTALSSGFEVAAAKRLGLWSEGGNTIERYARDCLISDRYGALDCWPVGKRVESGGKTKTKKVVLAGKNGNPESARKRKRRRVRKEFRLRAETCARTGLVWRRGVLSKAMGRRNSTRGSFRRPKWARVVL